MTADKDLVGRLREEAAYSGYPRAELYSDAAARAEPKSSHLNYEGSGRVATSVKDILNSRKVQQQVEAVRQLQTAPPDRAEPQPVAWQGVHEPWDLWLKKPDGPAVRPLSAAPPACALGGEAIGPLVPAVNDAYVLGFQEAREKVAKMLDEREANAIHARNQVPTKLWVASPEYDRWNQLAIAANNWAKDCRALEPKA